MFPIWWEGTVTSDGDKVAALSVPNNGKLQRLVSFDER